MHIDASNTTLGQTGSTILGTAASAKGVSPSSSEAATGASKSSKLFSASAMKDMLETRNVGSSGSGKIAPPDPATEGGASLNVYA